MRYTLAVRATLLAALACSFAFVYSTSAQDVGDEIILNSSNANGVPVHPTGTDARYFRWPNGTSGTVESIHPQSGWLEIETASGTGWVLKRYVTVVEGEGEEPADNEILTYAIGTWNIEHFKDGAKRGFPENTRGGPTYGPRTANDYAFIADIIGNRIGATLLVLTEINGRTLANGKTESRELVRLISNLGTEWDYRIGTSGGSQRVAFLFNSTQVRVDDFWEIPVPEEKVKDRPSDTSPKDIFDRDPIVGRFTFLGEQGAMNDFVIVGLHLASGQHLNVNHNRAMEVLAQRLLQDINSGRIPAGEKDLFIAGDLNASMYDTSDPENFWTDYMKAEFDIEVLAPPDVSNYDGTRLADVPLYPQSRIDYIMASSGPSGAFEELLAGTVATVHTALLPSNFNDFRRQASDHIPVTIRVTVRNDSD